MKAKQQKLIQQVGDELFEKCREYVVKDTGHEAAAASWAEISRVLQKYGYKPERPF